MTMMRAINYNSNMILNEIRNLRTEDLLALSKRIDNIEGILKPLIENR